MKKISIAAILALLGIGISFADPVCDSIGALANGCDQCFTGTVYEGQEIQDLNDTFISQNTNPSFTEYLWIHEGSPAGADLYTIDLESYAGSWTWSGGTVSGSGSTSIVSMMDVVNESVNTFQGNTYDSYAALESRRWVEAAPGETITFSNSAGITDTSVPAMNVRIDTSSAIYDGLNVLQSTESHVECKFFYPLYCGDGDFDPLNEQCDDGNDIDDDECSNNCLLNGGSGPVCGDAHNGDFEEAPITGLCAIGSVENFTEIPGGWSWGCQEGVSVSNCYANEVDCIGNCGGGNPSCGINTNVNGGAAPLVYTATCNPTGGSVFNRMEIRDDANVVVFTVDEPSFTVDLIDPGFYDVRCYVEGGGVTNDCRASVAVGNDTCEVFAIGSSGAAPFTSSLGCDGSNANNPELRVIHPDGYEDTIRATTAVYTFDLPGTYRVECTPNQDNIGNFCAQNVIVNAVCGNGTEEAGEQCDDGNTLSGDGCSGQCEIEGGPFCGNGIIEDGEQCDDGNNENGDACTNICQNRLVDTGTTPLWIFVVLLGCVLGVFTIRRKNS